MGWVFTDTTDEAIDGVYDGSYYAALIIPENFTEDMISFLGGEVDHPDIIYYEMPRKTPAIPRSHRRPRRLCRSR